ncbi:UDP-glucose 4-epimerase GalE [Tepidicaulis sp. LMO-SS28]|uniref:UDP-glucose 4-epimerase GalE n=1 Tax=Tepidicaulis sp. LMO-SS28 TaxID=3447455 RepID=UPI003EE0A4E6
MAVLVTGGAGYIGSHMVLALVDAGEETVVIDNLSTGFRWAVHPQAHFHEGDIADAALLGRLIRDYRIEAVVHFAGSIIVPESVENPLKYYLNNTAKSRDLIETCVSEGVPHFIFSSTAAVYGVPDVSPVTEDLPLAPISPYGTSKLMTEWMLRDTAAAHDLRYVALRYFNVAGADPKGRSGQSTRNATHLIKVASQTALGERAEMGIFGTDFPTPDGTGVRDYIHVSDLISAHMAALGHLQKGGASLAANCGYGRGFSVREVIAAVEEVSGKPVKAVEQPRRVGDPAELVSDPSLLKATLDWRPQHEDLKEIVSHALKWEAGLKEKLG